MLLNRPEFPRRNKRQFKSTEKATQSAVLDYLVKFNIFHYRNNSGAIRTDSRFLRFGAVGSPDIICVRDGKFIGIECKGEKGVMSEGQVAFRDNLEKAGGKYLLVRSIDEFIKLWNSD